MARGHPYFDLLAVASKEELNEEKMQALAVLHMTPVLVESLPPKLLSEYQFPA